MKESSNRHGERNRRTFLKLAGATVGVTAFAGCAGNGGDDATPTDTDTPNEDGGDGSTPTEDGGDGGTPTDDGGNGGTPTATVEGPVRIGLLLPLSGAFALTAQEVQRGAEMALEHIGGQVLNTDIEFVTQDTATQPDTALEGAQQLVLQEDVDAIVGPASSASGLSVIPYIQNEAQIPLLPSQVGSAAARSGDNCTDYAFFIWPSNYHYAPTGVQFIYDLPDHLDRDVDPNQIHYFGPDYTLGQNNLEIVRSEAQERGGEVTGSTFAPIGTQDLSSYISEIQQSEADFVTGVLTAGMATRLIDQGSDMGLAEEKVMMFNSGKPVAQIPYVSVGDSADGWYGTHFYNPASESDINQSFQDLYPDGSDLLPSAECASGFEPVRAIAQAIEQAGSTAADDMINELAGLNWNSVFGDATFRAGDGQVEVDFAGATRDGGEFTVLEEYPGVIGPNQC